MAEKKNNQMERAVGRRKTAVARVRIKPGKGSVVINDKELKDYFPMLIDQQIVLSPFAAIGRDGEFDATIKVVGGGVHAQAEAVQHGIARALIKWNEELKPVLKAEKFLTRDPRARERKKYGRRRARRGHQWKKR